MTAPAASLIQRQRPVREAPRDAVQPARTAHPSAQNTSVAEGFKAHLERRSPLSRVEQSGSEPVPAHNLQTAKRAPAPASPSESAPQSEPATDTATGKILPDKRQIPANAAAQAVQTLLSARAATEGEAVPAETAPSETKTETPVNAESASSAVALAASFVLAVPAPTLRTAVPLATAVPLQAGVAARTGAAPQPTAASPAASPTASTLPVAEVNSALSGLPSAGPVSLDPMSSGPATPAAAITPALSFVLERDATASNSPDLALADPTLTDGQTAPTQTTPRAETSTLAALTGAPAQGRAALRKARLEIEVALPGAKAPAEVAALSPALSPALTQPATGALPGSSDPAAPVAARPAEGIGFDALVDSIARARDGVADGAPVSVAMHHAEFGRVSMRFHTDADGLSVAMTSPDPGFAPAVAAAHAAEATASTEAAPRTQPANASINPGNDLSGSQMQGGTRSGAGQRQDAPPQPRTVAEPSRPPVRGSETPADDGRGGIFA